MNFGKTIKFAREQLSLSQEMLARELGVSFATINRLENSKTEPSYKTIKKFEDFCKRNKIKIEELR